jgi:putative FmdB family regulatory protein
MPVYTYQCQSCHNKFYVEEALFAKPQKHCPKCLTGIVRRVLPLPVVIFKGPGWYSDENRLAVSKPLISDQSNIPPSDPDRPL